MGRSQSVMRQLRADRISKGLCPTCGEANDRLPRYTCSACLEKSNERARKWRVDRLVARICPQCSGDMDREGWCCAACYQKIKQHMSELRRK